MQNQAPPSNESAERAVIGSAIVFGENAVAETDGLRSDEFFFPHHREAWTVLTKLAAAGKPMDPVSAGAEIKASGSSGKFSPSWNEWAFDVTSSACIPQQVKHFATMVRELAASRRLIELCVQVQAMALGGQPWDEQLRTAREGLAALEVLSTDSHTVHVSEAIREVTAEIEQIQAGVKLPRIYTGVSTIDKVMDGAEPGNLVIVAARPGVGKSAFVGNVAAFCGMHGVPSMFFSVEMMLRNIGRRWLAGDTRIDANKLKRGEIDVEQWHKIQASSGRFDTAELWVNDRVTHLGQIVGEARRWHSRVVAPKFEKSGKPDDKRALFVVDYAQRVKVGRERGDTREQEVAKIPMELKNLGKHTGSVVFLVVMLSREVEKRGGDPILADLRESGAFEQEADIVIFLAHSSEGHKAILAKNREGCTGWAPCLWSPEITTWASPTSEEYEGPTRRDLE